MRVLSDGRTRGRPPLGLIAVLSAVGWLAVLGGYVVIVDIVRWFL